MDSLLKRNVGLDALMPLIREELSAGKRVKFSPKGTSMLPMLRQGIDTVTLSAIPSRLQKYDLPLYQRDNGQYVLHRVVRADKTYTCIGDNQFQMETGLRHEQMIAIVIGFTRGEKYYSASAWQYRLYCHIWHRSRPFRRIVRGLLGKVRRLLK